MESVRFHCYLCVLTIRWQGFCQVMRTAQDNHRHGSTTEGIADHGFLTGPDLCRIEPELTVHQRGLGLKQPDPGQFTFTREGDLSEDLVVYFRTGGSTASIDDFYEGPLIAQRGIVIPANSPSITLTVTPFSDMTNRVYPKGTTNHDFVLVEGLERLALQIDNPHTDKPGYTIDPANNSAKVSVVDTLYQGNNNQPDAASVLQGSLGCFFASVVAGIIRQHGPQVIMNMIQDLNDGRYTVTLPGRPAVTFADPWPSPYTFISPFTAPLGYANGVWLTVLAHGYELATGNSIGGGSSVQQVMLALTGNDIAQDTFADITQDELHNRLVAAMQNQRVVVAGTTTGSPALGALGLVQNHGYTLWDYDANARMVTLRNPHGIGEFGQWDRNLNQLPLDGVDDGIFQLPLRTFHALFSFIQREQ